MPAFACQPKKYLFFCGWPRCAKQRMVLLNRFASDCQQEKFLFLPTPPSGLPRKRFSALVKLLEDAQLTSLSSACQSEKNIFLTDPATEAADETSTSLASGGQGKVSTFLKPLSAPPERRTRPSPEKRISTWQPCRCQQLLHVFWV